MALSTLMDTGRLIMSHRTQSNLTGVRSWICCQAIVSDQQKQNPNARGEVSHQDFFFENTRQLIANTPVYMAGAWTSRLNLLGN